MATSAFQLLLLGLVLALVTPFAKAATEAELRAAVIYNITRFVQWPQPVLRKGYLDLCTLGHNPVTEALAALEGKTLNEISIAVRPIQSKPDLTDCQMLYVANEQASRMPAVTDTLASSQAATLTISDAPSFLALGGMVQLVVVSNRQRFRVNQELAEKARLGISARLLQLALPGID